MEDMCNFLTLKMLQMALVLIKTKNCYHYFLTHLLKTTHFTWELSGQNNFPCKIGVFWPIGQNDGNFVFWSILEPLVTFLGLKTAYVLNELFLEHAVYYNCCLTWYFPLLNNRFWKVRVPIHHILMSWKFFMSHWCWKRLRWQNYLGKLN